MQIIHIHALKNFNVKTGKVSIITAYRNMHNAISENSKRYSVYILLIVVYVVFAGSVGLFARIEQLVSQDIHARTYSIQMTFYALVLFGDILDLIILFIWPLMAASGVSTAQKKLRILRILDGNEKDVEKHIKAGKTIRFLQSCDQIGYTICGSPITKWKTYLIAILGPLLKIMLSTTKDAIGKTCSDI